ncbi:MAG: hypothetical protein E5X61_40280, partial [Mesorhizobium sp.]
MSDVSLSSYAPVAGESQPIGAKPEPDGLRTNLLLGLAAYYRSAAERCRRAFVRYCSSVTVSSYAAVAGESQSFETKPEPDGIRANLLLGLAITFLLIFGGG